MPGDCQSPSPAAERVAAFHVHSTYSDGTLPVTRIARAARNAGCDLVFLTDHNSLKARDQGYEGWHDSVLVLVGEEVTSRDGSHYLAFGLDSAIPAGLPPQETVARVKGQGGFGFLAHPFAPQFNPLAQLAISPWRDWSATFDGLELWNATQRLVTAAFKPFGGLWHTLISPARALGGPGQRALTHWDDLLAKRKVVAAGGVDAHGLGVSYSDMFHTIRTHLLLSRAFTGSVEADRDLAFSALREGRSFIAGDLFANARGFGFSAGWGENAAGPGQEAPLGTNSQGVDLNVHAPSRCVIRLMHGGREIARETGDSLRFTASEPGPYRVEAYRPESRRPWVFTNPIWLT